MKKILELCRQYTKAHSVALFLYVSLCILLSVQSLATPYITGNFIDFLVSNDGNQRIIKYCLIYIFITGFGLVVGYFSKILYIRLQTTIAYEMNRSILTHLQRLPLSFVKYQDTVALNQRINNDSNTLISFYISLYQNIIINVLTIILGFAIIIRFNYIIACILFVLVPSYFFIFRLFRKLLYVRGLELKQNQTLYFSRLNEQIAYIKQIKIFGLFDVFSKRLDKFFRLTLSSAYSYQNASFAFTAVDTLVLCAAQVFLFLYGGHQVVSGSLTIGNFTIISSYFAMMLTSVRYFFSLGKSIQDSKVSYERITQIKNIPAETVGNVQLDQIESICLESVTLREGTRTIISDFNLTFTRGKIYLVEGLNGAGKSTLINLIIGLYIDEYDGKIIINGVPQNEIDMYSLRKKEFGICEQNPVLFEDTINYNFYFETQHKEENLSKQLINVLCLDGFIDGLAQGFNTTIDQHAATISGGERQKIALFRSLINSPSVLLLDEPTSALDAESTNNLLKYLQTTKESRITIIISHDEIVGQFADEVIRIEAGKHVVMDD